MCSSEVRAVALGLAFACAGCGAGARGGLVGASNGPIGASHDAPAIDAGVAEAGPSPIPSDFRTAMARLNTTRFTSRGHAGGRWDVDVYANRAGADALAAGGRVVGVGSVYVEEHFEKGDGGAGPIMMMEKRAPGFDAEHGDWRYVVVGSRGNVLKDGVEASCAGCHGDAPGDHVFRVE